MSALLTRSVSNPQWVSGVLSRAATVLRNGGFGAATATFFPRRRTVGLLIKDGV
jgi:hypothetical protein